MTKCQNNLFDFTWQMSKLNMDENEVEQNQNFVNEIQRRINVLNAKFDLKMKVENLLASLVVLKNNIEDNQKKLIHITNLSKQIVSIMKNYPMDDQKVNNYILETVKTIKLILDQEQKSEVSKESETIEKSTLVLNKIQNEILNLIDEDEKRLSDILNCEKRIEEILYYAEDDQYIGFTKDEESWKLQIKNHRAKLANPHLNTSTN